LGGFRTCERLTSVFEFFSSVAFAIFVVTGKNVFVFLLKKNEKPQDLEYEEKKECVKVVP
jgi:hypothetical protein